VFGLSLHGAVGIPLTSAMFAGNTSDQQANRLNLDQLADLLPPEDDITLVADCKLVDAPTLGQLLLHGFHFVSLLPATFGLRRELVAEVRATGEQLAELATRPGRRKEDPAYIYRGRSFVRPSAVGRGSQGDNHKRSTDLRFVVVESTQLAETEDAAIARKLAREADKFAKSFKTLARRRYACAADAETARDRLVDKLAWHTHHVEVVHEEVPKKRSGPGRPPKGEPVELVSTFRLVQSAPLQPQAEAVDDLRFHARHFVLVTDHLDADTWPDKRILEEYRHQNMIEGTCGFRWLKNVGSVAPMFLHTPSRIAALGVVLVLALMVRNYIQFTLRRRLTETGATVPDRKRRPTQSPTTETAFLSFAAASVVRILADGVLLQRRLAGLSDGARTILRMFDIDESVFTTPPGRPLNIRDGPSGPSGM
jgi:transposase